MNSFPGFDPNAFAFLRDLHEHNDRDWFHAHQAEYKELLLEPARSLVAALGERPRRRRPGIRTPTRA